MDLLHILYTTYAIVFGLLIGSFLNVCIIRIPQKESLLGRSHCTKCQHKVAWYDNFPVLSYILLGGKCRNCKDKISPIYPVVEIITALIAYWTFVSVDYNLPHFFIWFLLFAAPLIVITFIDFKLQIIPDVISLPMIPIGFLVVLYGKWPHYLDALKFSGIGFLVGGGSLYLLGILYYLLRKNEGMGGGDVKLCAALGAFLGWKSMILVFLSSSIMALVFAIVITLLRRKKDEQLIIPYGPFLSAGAMLAAFNGNELISLYLKASGLTIG